MRILRGLRTTCSRKIDFGRDDLQSHVTYSGDMFRSSSGGGHPGRRTSFTETCLFHRALAKRRSCIKNNRAWCLLHVAITYLPNVQSASRHCLATANLTMRLVVLSLFPAWDAVQLLRARCAKRTWLCRACAQGSNAKSRWTIPLAVTLSGKMVSAGRPPGLFVRCATEVRRSGWCHRREMLWRERREVSCGR